MSIKELVNGAVVVPPNDGQPWWVLGHLLDIKAMGDHTLGTYSLTEVTVAPAPIPGPPPHIHKAEEEAIYVVEGTVNVRLGDETIVAEPGAFIFMPRGTVHTFWNPGSTPARFILILSPPGFEGFFREAGEPASARVLPKPAERPPKVEKLVAIARKYNMELLLPTGRSS